MAVCPGDEELGALLEGHDELPGLDGHRGDQAVPKAGDVVWYPIQNIATPWGGGGLGPFLK